MRESRKSCASLEKQVSVEHTLRYLCKVMVANAMSLALVGETFIGDLKV